MNANDNVFKSEKWIQHEVETKLQVEIQKWQASDIYRRLEALDRKIDNKFTWFYSAVIIILAMPKVLHYFGWTL